MIANRRSLIAIVALALTAFLGTLVVTRINGSKLIEATNELRALQETENQLHLRALEGAGSKDGEMRLPEEAIWAHVDRGQAEAAVQQVLVRAANDAGMTVVSFGATATPPSVKIPAIAYEIEMEGGHHELAKFISALELQKPRLAVSYLWARQIAGMGERFISPVSLRLSVWGFLPNEVD